MGWAHAVENQQQKSIVAPGQSILMTLLFNYSGGHNSTEFYVNAEYESPLGVAVYDRYKVHGMIQNMTLLSGGAQPVPQLLESAAKPVESQSKSIGAQPVPQLNFEDFIGKNAFSQLSWGHHILLIQKLKDIPTRMWYARQSIEQGWSRDVLTAQIKSQAHQCQGAAITNFGDKLPAMHAQLATGVLKDPFIFDFLTLEEPFHERELETGLLHHIEKFLLELGRGFAFVGRQYRLYVSDRDYYLDLKPIGVADYELTRALPEKLASSLPSIEAIEAELSQDLTTEGES